LPTINVIIGNPPYTNGIHLKHLQQAYDTTDRIVIFLQPMAWVHSQKPGQNSLKKEADAIKRLIHDHFVSFRILNGNKVFGIKFGQVCGFTLIDKTKDHPEVIVDDRTVGIFKVFPDAMLINPMYLDPAMFESLKATLWNYCAANNIERMINQPNGPFFVNLPLISGHVDESGKTDAFLKSDFYQLIYEADKVVALEPKINKQNRWLAFTTKVEAENCIDYLANSKLAKFCLMIVKGQQNLHRGELLYVPWFDFSIPQRDADLYRLLGLSDDQINVIKSVAGSTTAP
jgi:hypothetical protein